MRTNTKPPIERTHEGAPSISLQPAAQLRRTVMACLLWEDNFYESGESVADRMRELVKRVAFEDAAQIAVDAREKMKLRHAPLFIVREMLRLHKGRQVGDLIARVIQRPDECAELLALYWKDGKQPLTSQLKIGLARALKKFDAYQLAKWDKNNAAISLQDVLFLSHARAKGDKQQALFEKLAANKLETPDTWETELSGGADKRATFERLMAERKLGAMALLRNLRGMLEAGVSEDAIRNALASMKADRVLPFRFIAAARYAPRLKDSLEQAMFRCLADSAPLAGKTKLLVDVSGSMKSRISSKSEMTRMDAACGLAMLIRELCERCAIITFSDRAVLVPSRRGFALRDAIVGSQPHDGTRLGDAMITSSNILPDCDRTIVITDEQSAGRPPRPQGKGYIINVASYRNGIGYGPWVTVDGWSESIIEYIRACEAAGS